jgi:hypothetical protein
MIENAKLRDENFVSVEDASTICSNEDSVDLEALNLICSEVVEGLGDGSCDPLILQTPVSQKREGTLDTNIKVIKVSPDERNFLEL